MSKPINKVVKILITGDFFLSCGWGLLAPVFAIFIIQKITIGSAREAAEVAGFASFFYWGVKSILQIPVGKYLDRNQGEKDDFWFMVLGTFLTVLAPIGFIFSSLPWHIYFFQALHGMAMALVVPSWAAIFTRHIDKKREAFEWSLDSTFLGVAVGITGAIGGIMVASFGFLALFIFIAGFNLISGILLLSIYKEISPRDHTLKFPRVPPVKTFIKLFK